MSVKTILTKKEKVAFMKSCYNRNNQKPAMGFFVGNEYPNIRYKCYSDLPTSRPLKPEDFPIEPFLEECERLYNEHLACPGYLFWTGTPFWGIPWVEAMLGCNIYFNKGSQSIYSSPIHPSITPDDIPEFNLYNPWITKLLDFYKALETHSDGRYPIGTTRIRGLADILSALLGGEEFIMRAVLNPDSIKDLLNKITPFYRHLMNTQIEVIPLYFGGIGSFYYYNWAPTNTRWHQEDSSMLLSPNLYSELIEPYNKLIYKDGNNICHFHSTGGFIPYREVLNLNPLAIEMHLDCGGLRAKELHQDHLKILETTPLIIWGEFTDEDFEWIFSQLPTEGLILSVCVSSPDEAMHIWTKWMN